MKTSITKLLTLTTVILGTNAAMSANEGYFSFIGFMSNSGGLGAWENFSSGVLQRAPGTVNVTFYWGPTNATPLVDTLLAFTPTNEVHDLGGLGWNYVLNDPNFTQAINATTGEPVVATVNASGVNRGGFSYNGGVSFPVAGTVTSPSSGDVPYAVYVIGWSAAYLTPEAAASAGSPLGWSNAGLYFPAVDSGSAVLSFSASGIRAFGVTVPEPSALAIIGAGVIFYIMRRSR